MAQQKQVITTVGIKTKARISTELLRSRKSPCPTSVLTPPSASLHPTMQGLDLTFETLARSRNEAAIDVLISGLDHQDPNHRQRALSALLARSESRAPEQVLGCWSKLEAPDIEILRARKSWLVKAVEQALTKGAEEIELAMSAAQDLGLTPVLPKLISFAESAAIRSVRIRAGDVVRTIVEPIGRDARKDRDQATVRGPVIARLADSLRRFSMHRNQQLIESFLVCSSWSDPGFRQFLTEGGPESELIFKLFAESNHPSVLELLAGFIRRRNVDERIQRVIRSRADEPFRSALLKTVGNEPTQVVLKNLAEMGMPRCCLGGEATLKDLPADCRASLVHVHVACNPDYVEALHLIAATIEVGTQDGITAGTIALPRCEIPNADSWMRAALRIGDEATSQPGDDETARLLQRLVKLLAHPDPALNRSLRRALSALHASEVLPEFQSLRPRSRRRLGRVVMQIDPDAIERVRDALRHPVLSKRLEAIAMADAIGVVDLLYDSFEHIAREDHQEARMRAAEALSGAASPETLRLLEEMVELPACPVRDTAILAIQRRQHSSSSTRSNATEAPTC